MNEHKKKVEALFEGALGTTTPEQRAAYLERECGGNTALRVEVEALLRAVERAGGFLAADTGGEAGDTARAALPPMQKPGDRIGRYKLLQQIGEGGCGVVYMAEQEEPVRRKVALKIIKLGMDTKQVIARFEAERQALALMEHPNIAKVFDAGATETGRPYFVMELVRGIKITDYCDEHQLSTQQRLDLFVQVCQAIQHAHQKGIIHRDLKPSNVLVADHDGVPVPKVIDFGIAKATTDQPLTDKTLFTAFEQFLGTPAYMSPEQARLSGLEMDARTDIYSLGVLLYELLTGRTPLDQKELVAAGLEEMRRVIQEKEPPRPSALLSTMLESELTTTAKHRQTDPPKLLHTVRGDLDWIVMKCLEKERSRRYETANGLATDITRHLNDEPVVARPPSVLYSLKKKVRRHKVAFAAAAVVVVVAVLGIALTTREARRAARAEQARKAEAERAAAASESQKTLSDSDFRQAVRLIAEDNAADATPYLVRSLSVNPTNDAALTRLATLLAYRTWMLPTLILKLEGAVNSADLSSDGQRIVTASADGSARVWDVRTGQALLEPMKHASSVKSAKFSPDGKRILTVSGDAVRVWNGETGRLLIELAPSTKSAATTTPKLDADLPPLPTPPPPDGVVSAQFSSDGKNIETFSRDNKLRVWNAQSGQPVGDAVVGTNLADAKLLSRDGKRKISIVSGRRVRAMDAQTGQPLTEPMPHEAEVSAARFSPDGQRIATVCNDETVRVWEAQTAPPLPTRFPESPMFYRYDVYALRPEFSPDGGRILMPARRDNEILVWDVRTGEVLARVTNNTVVNTVRFSPDGSRILTTDGNVLAGGRVNPSAENAARVWDARTGQPQGEPMKHAGRILSAQFNPEGKRILTVSLEAEVGKAHLWDAQTGVPLITLQAHCGMAHFSLDGKHVLTVSKLYENRASARLWDAQTGQPLNEPVIFGDEGRSMLVPTSSDGRRILIAGPGWFRLWDAQTGRPVTGPMTYGPPEDDGFNPILSLPDGFCPIEFSGDGKRIFTASVDWVNPVPAHACVWDAQTGQLLAEQRSLGAPRVDSAHFSPDGKRIVTTRGDTVRLWDTQTGQPLADPLSTGTRGNAWCSTLIIPDGKRILTLEDHPHLWDISPTPTGYPVWLFRLAEALSGKVLSKDGVPEPTRLNRLEVLAQIRKQLGEQPADDNWVTWGRWVLADHATRNISPFSKISVPEHVNRLIRENWLASLEEAVQLAPTNSLAFARLALLLINPARLQSAEHCARYALKLDSENGEAWRALAAIQAMQDRTEEALGAINRTLELQPGSALAWEAKGEILEKTNRLAEALTAYTRQVELRLAATNQTTAESRSALLKRDRVLKRLGRWKEAGQDVCHACGIPGGWDTGWTRWETSAGGNGHWYKAVLATNGISWGDADVLAPQTATSPPSLPRRKMIGSSPSSTRQRISTVGRARGHISAAIRKRAPKNRMAVGAGSPERLGTTPVGIRSSRTIGTARTGCTTTAAPSKSQEPHGTMGQFPTNASADASLSGKNENHFGLRG